MITALAITVFLSCSGLPDHVVVERDGISRCMEVAARSIPDPVGGFSYDITSGNEDIQLHSQVWIALRQQGRGVVIINECRRG